MSLLHQDSSLPLWTFKRGTTAVLNLVRFPNPLASGSWGNLTILNPAADKPWDKKHFSYTASAVVRFPNLLYVIWGTRLRFGLQTDLHLHVVLRCMPRLFYLCNSCNSPIINTSWHCLLCIRRWSGCESFSSLHQIIYLIHTKVVFKSHSEMSNAIKFLPILDSREFKVLSWKSILIYFIFALAQFYIWKQALAKLI